MKKLFAVLLISVLAGCAQNQAVLPSLEGKPRMKINASQPTKPLPVLVAPIDNSSTNTQE